MLAHALLGLLAASTVLHAEEPLRIGIRLQVPDRTPNALVSAMMRETERHWKFPTLVLHWHKPGEPCRGEDHRLVIVQMQGHCTLHRFPRGERSKSLGFTHVSDGRVLPFIEIDCDAVAESVMKATSSSTAFLNVNAYARGLAAVLTHEMVHALTESCDHGESGVMLPSLTPKQLMEPDLVMTPETIQELEEALGVPLAAAQSY